MTDEENRDVDTEGDAAKPEGAARVARSRPNKAERAAANAYWRLWRRNWRPPFRRGDTPPTFDGDR